MENVSSLEITKTNLENALRSQFGNDVNFTVTDNGDGSFTIKFDDTDRIYYVDSSGNIIDNSNILKISTADELKAFRDDVNSGSDFSGKVVLLMNDITLDINEEWTPIGYYTMSSTSPFNDENKPFKGTFDGNGYAINGVYINTTNKVQGLFGLVMNGKIKNLTVGEECNITGGISTGGIAGYLYESAVINVCNMANITVEDAKQLIGGICGQSYNSTISNSYNSGEINGTGRYVGGITGNLYHNSIIENCYNVGKVNNTENCTGGIVGILSDNSIIKKSYNLEDITGGSWTGGIAGIDEYAMIQESYNIGLITGKDNNVGGIAGKITTNAIVENCYNIGKIIGEKDYVGGILGHIEDYSTISNCYNIGLISATLATDVGGIVGKITGIITTASSFFLTECIENGNTINGVKECTESEIKNLVGQLGSKWKEDTNNINQGYPILNWQ